MVWNAYLLVFSLLAPLHVGWRKVSNLQQTRSYLTGKNLWGSLTARLARDVSAYGGDYIKAGEDVNKYLKFSYFYPIKNSPDSLKQMDFWENEIIWPWEQSNNYNTFSWHFLNSYAGTALSGNRSAEEGSLHETEFISPVTRENEQVFLVGYVFERVDCPEKLQWKGLLNKLQFGGERSYGWGRVKLYDEEPEKLTQNGTQCNCFAYTVCLDNEIGPIVNLNQNNSLLAHTLIDKTEYKCIGSVEPLVGRHTARAEFFGGKTGSHNICWVPGSKVIAGEQFIIKDYGIWQCIKIGHPC